MIRISNVHRIEKNAVIVVLFGLGHGIMLIYNRDHLLSGISKVAVLSRRRVTRMK
jgi:hypothetical protein